MHNQVRQFLESLDLVVQINLPSRAFTPFVRIGRIEVRVERQNWSVFILMCCDVLTDGIKNFLEFLFHRFYFRLWFLRLRIVMESKRTFVNDNSGLLHPSFAQDFGQRSGHRSGWRLDVL